MGLPPDLPPVALIFELNAAYVAWCDAGDRFWEIALLRSRSVVVPEAELAFVSQTFDDAYARLVSIVGDL